MKPYLSPIAVVLFGLGLVLLSALLQRRWLVLLSLLVALGGVAAMTPIVANALLLTLERQADPAPGECEGVQAVVLLAGGTQRPAGHVDDFSALTFASLQRGFVYLDRGHDPDLPLVVAGGSRYRVAESQVLGTLLDSLGLTANPLMLETASLTTEENAQEVRRLLPPDTIRIGLATSAVHMPRAMRSFAAAGFEVCRMPLDRMYVNAGGLWAFWPQASALNKTEAALHEMVGEMYYRVRHGNAR
jgi:uncharacterized SAM-binding protein YcdF (DUF218 family)